jgi:hypothetical protein
MVKLLSKKASPKLQFSGKLPDFNALFTEIILVLSELGNGQRGSNFQFSKPGITDAGVFRGPARPDQ